MHDVRMGRTLGLHGEGHGDGRRRAKGSGRRRGAPWWMLPKNRCCERLRSYLSVLVTSRRAFSKGCCPHNRGGPRMFDSRPGLPSLAPAPSGEINNMAPTAAGVVDPDHRRYPPIHWFTREETDSTGDNENARPLIGPSPTPRTAPDSHEVLAGRALPPAHHRRPPNITYPRGDDHHHLAIAQAAAF